MSGAVLATVARNPGDLTPDAVNWDNISGASGSVNNNQTVAGISGLMPVFWVGDHFVGAGGTLSYRLDSGSYVPVASVTTFGVTNGQTLNWKAELGSTGGPYTIIIRYGVPPLGSGNWDTFTVTIT